MILLNRGEIASAIVTVSEKTTLPAPYFLLAFTHDITKKVIAVVLPDMSGYPERFNRFEVDTALFDDSDNGFYTYQIYEQEDPDNIDPALAGARLEIGKAKLLGEKIAPVQYQDTPTEYTTYGQ